ncbi:uncharacterized protein FTJAE_9102 [Fusarium tjaetaba]|uniref:Zn(2)-C6 fungal-type domain-containing protein n=1 Tax=Fusarium tjaetaba TaxID=1567544 RepID=A0A8H5R6Y1_9HYPO|nr:uncharacterized protein FTJAE_9102 [Fusarium tjaetaba]KAF5627834.1 hypothetical protein FTJAE_9102 [Fusarium tjaetaba]
MSSPQRASRVCRICKAKKKACGKELPTCSYCFKRGFDCIYDTESDTPPMNDDVAEVFKPWSLTLFPMAISTATLDSTMAYHMHYLYRVVGQSPLQAGKRFLDNFQKWLPIIAPRHLYEHIELSERGLPGADISVLLLAICLVTLRSGGVLDDPLFHHSAVHVTVKTLYAQVQAMMQASVALIQTGIILSAYEYASGQIDSAYISIAACIRMAQVAGVDTACKKLTAVQEETRLQATSEWNLWWSNIVLERFILLEHSSNGRPDPIAVCPSSDVPLPSDTESNGEYIPTYCTMSSSTIQNSSSLKLQERMSVFMAQTPHEPGLRCGTIATVVRSLYILHEKILSIAGSLSADADRDGWVNSSEAALETITKIMVDVAKHHLDYIARSDVESLAFCCALSIAFMTHREAADSYPGGQRSTAEVLEISENLKCLYFTDRDHAKPSTQPTLGLDTINAFTQRKYVALSYTWKPSPEEAGVPHGGYLIEELRSGIVEPSSVRDVVFSRIKRYMDHVNCKYLWIDKHCIVQEEGEEKEIEILSGTFVTKRGSSYLLSSSERALDALQLLRYITSDLWFTRGWTYQENYRANMKMTLLIANSSGLSHEKPVRHFGSLDGELLISSASLYEQATKLCLAYSNQQPPPPHLDSILSRAKRYTILLANEEDSAPVSMSPSIIEDIASRNLDREWDRLAIIANCCQYANRLNSAQLQADKNSLSLSILTLVLMNGEILSNHPRDKLDVKTMTITEFLHKHFFNGLQSPWKKAKLTFNKSCRFANVILTEEGVQTEGYIWRLDDEISTASFYRYMQPHGKKRYRQPAKRPLEWLAGELASEYRVLSDRLDEILDLEVPSSAAEEWLLSMVDKVEEAILRGKLLCTATLLGPGPLGVAVFVQPEDSDDESSGTGSEMSLDRDQDRHVFTSFQRAQTDRGGFDLNDLDKHVSLEVDYDAGNSDILLPQLYTKRWIHGLCFYHGCTPQKVVFPWPSSLEEL